MSIVRLVAFILRFLRLLVTLITLATLVILLHTHPAMLPQPASATTGASATAQMTWPSAAEPQVRTANPANSIDIYAALAPLATALGESR